MALVVPASGHTDFFPNLSYHNDAQQVDRAGPDGASDVNAVNLHHNLSHTAISNVQSQPIRPRLKSKTSKAVKASKDKYDRTAILECPHAGCPKTFNRPAKLEDHLNAHSGERPFACTQCGQTYKKRTHLAHHTVSQHTTERPWKCQLEGCEKTFATRQKLNAHDQTHIKQNKYRCRDYPPCQRHFRKAETLHRHIEQEHRKPSSDELDEIDGMTSDRDTGSTKQTNRKKFVCPEKGCEATLTRKGDVKGHLAAVHNVGNLFVCGTTNLSSCKGLEHFDDSRGCGAQYSQKVSLENHVRSQHLHAEQGPQPSQNTGADAFTTQNSHAANRPSDYSCRGCSQTFPLDVELADHLSSVHRFEEEYIVEAIAEQDALNGGRFWVGPPDDAPDPFLEDEQDGMSNVPFTFLEEDSVPVGCIDPGLLRRDERDH